MKNISSRFKQINKRQKNLEDVFPEFKSNLTIQTYINEKLSKINLGSNKNENNSKNMSLTMKKGNNNVNRTKSLKKMKKINTSSTNQSERNYSKERNSDFLKEISTSAFIFPLENNIYEKEESKFENNEIEIEMLREENMKLKNELNESKNKIVELEKVIQNLKDIYPISKEKCPIPMPAVIKASYLKNHSFDMKIIENKKMKKKIKERSKNNHSNYNPSISINELIITE